MKKGFTLIELLAVIVILAIIALIAVPIVLNIIDESRESSILRSAEFYLDAVDYTIADEVLNKGGITDGKYPITLEGNICKTSLPCDEQNTLVVEVKGKKPTYGTITIESGDIVDISILLDEKLIVKNSVGELVYYVSPCKLINGDKNTLGSKYECEVKPGTKYNFYVLSQESDGTTNLIMDRNICKDGTPATEKNKCLVAWISESDYGCGGIGDDCSTNEKGPITAMNYLNQATSTWDNIKNLNLKYNDEGGHFVDFLLQGKARLPYHRELNEAGCKDYQAFSCPVWMIDYLRDGSTSSETKYQENSLEGINGYWTLLSNPSSFLTSWFIGYKGYGNNTSVFNYYSFGVRPVINVRL